MDFLPDAVTLSRFQFAFTAMFHILWPVLTVGLGVFLLVLEALWLKTGDHDYYRHARFWATLFTLNFTIGVVTGLPLEFEFGTNWAQFSAAAGDFFGNILGFEGAMAFMLEAGFLGIMLLGWQRVPRGMHFFATLMVVLGASLSVFWIMVANTWLQHPAGGEFQRGIFVVQDYWQAIFNPMLLASVAHMWLAALETGLFVILGITAWYLLKGRETAFFLKALRLALLLALIVAPLQIWMGDTSGRNVFEHQPAKGAAIEGHWHTNPPGDSAAWALLAWPDATTQSNQWAITIPHALSILATHTWDGKVVGLRDIPVAEQPPALPLLFYSFRIMVAVGGWFLLLSLWSLWVCWRGGLQADTVGQHPWLLRAWLYSLPLGYVAVECGWIVREVGRQPWLIYGVMHTDAGASLLPASVVATSLGIYALIYAGLLLAFWVFARRWLQQGPKPLEDLL
ncbi:MAG: cytochrome ubiquinol oxidase subunit I [Thiothrix lacustris]|uniref:Cytochrome ubiquinol oxidase subunit I n=1 Tax=Thiothrix lacustris TaxID=525917 RepID=A0A1Y1QUR6_9GAMM|nr:MAG: cytochrome ubiquinol oxidase subunit I [Thiothrix lacustris]